jgi:DNA-directed RNA polymerase subunit M/transcription elongation factor TFIIS
MTKSILMLLAAACGACSASVVTAGEAEKLMQLPPASLARWYKPLNERQVWLHNMFKLRREMQAVREYAALEDGPRLEKWAGRLVRHYRQIGEMVPEWQDELELRVADELQQAAADAAFERVGKAARKLGLSCRSCHREYRATAALLYRTPDFAKINVEKSETLEEVSYKQLMGRLSLLLNRVKIASEDGRKSSALESLDELQQNLEDLGESCAQCHRDERPRRRILGEEARDKLAVVRRGLEVGDAKATGRGLGEVAVYTCARCHGVHRTLYDIRRELEP